MRPRFRPNVADLHDRQPRALPGDFGGGGKRLRPQPAAIGQKHHIPFQYLRLAQHPCRETQAPIRPAAGIRHGVGAENRQILAKLGGVGGHVGRHVGIAREDHEARRPRPERRDTEPAHRQKLRPARVFQDRRRQVDHENHPVEIAE